MKYALAALTSIGALVCLTCAPRAEAGGHGIRVDLPCPYGGSGLSSGWSAPTTSSPSPFNPGLITATSATLVGGSSIDTDDIGLALSTTGQTVQYDWYTAPLPSVLTCPGAPFSAPSPIEQVISYALASGGALSLASGDTEVEFNYSSTVAGVSGTASFTEGGVTYTSAGGKLPTATDNDFLFSSTGKLLGFLSDSPQDIPQLTANKLPLGWTSSSGGTGTVSAPEIDISYAAAALTLLAGGITVVASRRRRGSALAGLRT